jgi:RNA-directed DNA polymerase
MTLFRRALNKVIPQRRSFWGMRKKKSSSVVNWKEPVENTLERKMDLQKLYEELQNGNHDEDYTELCINYARTLLNNGMPVIFDTDHLSKLIGISSHELYSYYLFANNLYTEVKLPKKNGSFRTINAPSENLKYIQKWILDNILYNKNCSHFANGFIKDKSIVDNARPHVGKPCVINLDIKDFFPTIKYIDIYKLFKGFGYTSHLSMVLTGISTYNNVLPQGAPTSPYLSNLICRNLDVKFENLANRISASYTRYADDITFSGEKSITKYIALIKSIIKSEGFTINEKKVRVQYQYHKQMVTGLIVNEKLSVPKSTKMYLRQQIYFSIKYGVTNNLERQNINKSNYKDHLYGIAYFIKMVEPLVGEQYIKQLNGIDWES